MYDKKDKTSKCLPIKQIAQVPGFYTDDVEAALNTESEIPGNDVIDKLNRGVRVVQTCPVPTSCR